MNPAPEPAASSTPVSVGSHPPVTPLPLVDDLSAVVPVATTNSAPAAVVPASPRAIRLIELALLLAVAFGGAVYASLYAFFGERATGSGGSYPWLYSLVHELTALGLCSYLLHKQGRTFRQIGLNWRRSDPLATAAILVVSFVATMSVSYCLYFTGHYSVAARASQAAAVTHVAGAGLGWGMIVFTVVNGFFEELIVRAYLMTDVTFLTGSATLAVLVSALFQGIYHLYQGWQSALSVTVGFFVLSTYYARTRRITPVVLAHVLWDLGLLLTLPHSQGHR